MRSDLLVMGAGPAGLALAGAAAERGLSVTIVDPAPDSPWDRNFAMWQCEADGVGDLAPVEASWSRPVVDLGGEGRVELTARYCRIDVGALRARLVDRARSAGVRVQRGRVVAIDHGSRGGRVRLGEEAALHAEIVIDATGARSPWVRRAPPREAGWQAAHGLLLDVEAHPYADGEMALMDYRPIAGEPPLPTFLYALPLGPNRIFVEETSLVARPAVAQPVLASRLQARLRGMGIAVRETLAVERCLIPMGDPLPVPEQPIVAFGAAGGMVHPATGYQLARALALAPAVAAALAGTGAPASRRRRAHDVIWPAARRRAWELYTFGMEALLRLDADTIRGFFRGFFRLAPTTWLPYLRGTASPASIAWVMLELLARTSGRARWELCHLGATQGRNLVRAFAGGAP
jgi:lycopene cyclase-like protein